MYFAKFAQNKWNRFTHWRSNRPYTLCSVCILVAFIICLSDKVQEKRCYVNKFIFYGEGTVLHVLWLLILFCWKYSFYDCRPYRRHHQVRVVHILGQYQSEHASATVNDYIVSFRWVRQLTVARSFFQETHAIPTQTRE